MRLSGAVQDLADEELVDFLDDLCQALAVSTSPDFVAAIRCVPLTQMRAWLVEIARKVEGHRPQPDL